jgi:hypothetical protein
MGPLVHALNMEHRHHLFTDYWIGYRLSFETRERIIAAPIVGAMRYTPYYTEVAGSADPVYLFVDGSKHDRQLAAELHQLGITYTHLTPGGFSVYVPDRKVLPSQLSFT